MEEFDKFSTQLLEQFQSFIPSVAGKYKLPSSKREHLWREFQVLRVGRMVWKNIITKLDMKKCMCE